MAITDRSTSGFSATGPVWKFEGTPEVRLTAPGDGTVTRSSALADERIAGGTQHWLRSPVHWEGTFFIGDRHATFLRNPTFQDNLLNILLSQETIEDRLNRGEVPRLKRLRPVRAIADLPGPTGVDP